MGFHITMEFEANGSFSPLWGRRQKVYRFSSSGDVGRQLILPSLQDLTRQNTAYYTLRIFTYTVCTHGTQWTVEWAGIRRKETKRLGVPPTLINIKSLRRLLDWTTGPDISSTLWTICFVLFCFFNFHQLFHFLSSHTKSCLFKSSAFLLFNSLPPP